MIGANSARIRELDPATADIEEYDSNNSGSPPGPATGRYTSSACPAVSNRFSGPSSELTSDTTSPLDSDAILSSSSS